MVLKTKPIPLSRGRISPVTKLVMKALSLAERLLHAEYELIVLAIKPEGAPRKTEEAVAPREGSATSGDTSHAGGETP